MTGDDRAETELGLAAEAPTEFHDPVPVDSQEAWSIEDVTVEFDSERASWHRVAAIGGAIVAVAAVTAGTIIAWDRYRQPTEHAQAAAPPPPVIVADPEPAATWHLNGTYRVDIRNPEGITYNLDGTTTNMSDFRIPVRSNWIAYKTECEPTDCTTHSVLLDAVSHRRESTTDEQLARYVRTPMRWNGTEWATAGDGPHGGTTILVECEDTGRPDRVEIWSTLAPLPDGSFQGTSHRYFMTRECVSMDGMEVPVTATRIGDIPPGIDF